MQTVDILSVGVHAQRFDDAVERLFAWSQDSEKRYVCTCPVYTLMMAKEMPDARQAIEGADMVTADGMPLVWVQQYKGVREAERCSGPNLMRALCDKTAGTDVRHYLWGGQPGVPDKLAHNLRDYYGDVNIVGKYAPPFEPIGTPPNPDYIDMINAAAPDMVWVGLGSPKQDIWMHRYREYLDAPLLIGVGAAFDFISGRKAQAPRWMQENGLEWSFRLFQEPRRLAVRYLKYNTLFVWQLMTGRG